MWFFFTCGEQIRISQLMRRKDVGGLSQDGGAFLWGKM